MQVALKGMVNGAGRDLSRLHKSSPLGKGLCGRGRDLCSQQPAGRPDLIPLAWCSG